MTQLMFVIANEPHRPVTALRRNLLRRLDHVPHKALAEQPGRRFRPGAETATAMRSAAGELSP